MVPIHDTENAKTTFDYDSSTQNIPSPISPSTNQTHLRTSTRTQFLQPSSQPLHNELSPPNMSSFRSNQAASFNLKTNAGGLSMEIHSAASSIISDSSGAESDSSLAHFPINHLSEGVTYGSGHHRGPLNVPFMRQFRGVLLFTDITRFTSLSERLCARGVLGVEKLAKHLNKYFGKIIELISSHGGELYKFAGDALISVFAEDHKSTKSDEELYSHLCLKVIQCGLEIQKKLGRYRIEDDEEPFILQLRIGIGAGVMQAFHVGGVDNYVEYILNGEAFAQLPSTITGAEGHVVCSPVLCG